LAVGVGIVVGVPVGDAVGVGETVGITVGVPVGAAVGDAEGVGETVGIAVGVPLGPAVGVAEGVGEAVGIAVGVPLGPAVGDTVGVAEGVGVNPARAGVTVSKMRLSVRRILSKIFERSIFSPQSLVCPRPVGHRGFISRTRTDGSVPIIPAGPAKRESKNSASHPWIPRIGWIY